jgi:hypothetical protein
MEFDRIIAQAQNIAAERPLRTSLQKHEIDQITEFLYAHELMADDEDRNAGGSEALFQDAPVGTGSRSSCRGGAAGARPDTTPSA